MRVSTYTLGGWERRTASSDEPVHALGGSGEGTAEEEETDASHHDGPAAEDVCQTAGEGEDGGGSETVGSTDPDEVVVSVKLVCDCGECGGDGGDIECAEEVADDDGGEGEPEYGAFEMASLGFGFGQKRGG